MIKEMKSRAFALSASIAILAAAVPSAASAAQCLVCNPPDGCVALWVCCYRVLVVCG